MLGFTGYELLGAVVLWLYLVCVSARNSARAEGQPKGLCAGLLPVFSWVLALKSLIINGNRFCRFACFFV